MKLWLGFLGSLTILVYFVCVFLLHIVGNRFPYFYYLFVLAVPVLLDISTIRFCRYQPLFHWGKFLSFSPNPTQP